MSPASGMATESPPRVPWGGGGPLLVLGLLLLGACVTVRAPGEEGFPYNLAGEYEARFEADDGVVYTGTVRLDTEFGGGVTGRLALRSPVQLDGAVSGVLLEDRLTFTVDYEVAGEECGGVVTGDGTVAEGGGTVTGDVDIRDECGGGPTSASFRWTRRDEPES